MPCKTSSLTIPYGFSSLSSTISAKYSLMYLLYISFTLKEIFCFATKILFCNETELSETGAK